jgi:hypothetical protein
MRKATWCTVTVLLALVTWAAVQPAAAEAQRRGAHINPWSFSPYAGLFSDPYDVSPDGDDTGWMLGFRIGYALGDRTRLSGNVAYAESDDVTSGPITVDRSVYDNQYILTTAGLEYDILPGNTSVSLGAELGGAWRQVAFDHRFSGGAPAADAGDGYTFYFAVVPTLVVRHGFTPRTAVELGLRDYIFPEDEVQHAPALSFGFRFR